ncbi:MAG: DUF87 domain-containing protein [Nitrososphaerota archaeon]|nr:DUF87 domain-containing protein [Nitrososphaerota archaeon]
MSESDGGQALLDIGTKADGAFSVDANVVATGRTCVLGSSGSGKSYAVGVICEELCRNGVPFAVVDTEGEHTGLKEKFEAIWVGEESGCDLSWEGLDLEDLARQAPDISPLILDVSDIPDAKEKVARFMGELYKTLTERRTPYLVVVEEALARVPPAAVRLYLASHPYRRDWSFEWEGLVHSAQLAAQIASLLRLQGEAKLEASPQPPPSRNLGLFSGGGLDHHASGRSLHAAPLPHKTLDAGIAAGEAMEVAVPDVEHADLRPVLPGMNDVLARVGPVFGSSPYRSVLPQSSTW